MIKQSPVVILMAIAIGWMADKMNSLEGRVDACNSNVIEIYQSQSDRLLNVVERNSEAMENLSIYLKTAKK